MKSYILSANTPAGIEVPIGQSINTAANESKPHLKCGRLVGDKDKTPRKRKMQEKQVVAHEEAIPMTQATKIINLSKIYNSPKNKPFENYPLEEESLKGYPLKRIRYLKIMRSQ